LLLQHEEGEATKQKTKKTGSPALGGVRRSVKRQMKAAEEVNGESQELPCSGAVLKKAAATVHILGPKTEVKTTHLQPRSESLHC